MVEFTVELSFENQTKPNQRLVKEEDEERWVMRLIIWFSWTETSFKVQLWTIQPNQTKANKWVSFDIFISFDWCFIWLFHFFEFSLIEIELSFRFKSQLCFSNLLINCDNSPTHNWLNNQSNMSCMNLNLIYSKQTIVWLKGSVWFWFLVWDFELKNWFNDW